MSILATLKTYWSATPALNNALPSTKLYLDYVKKGTAFPYARITVLGSKGDYLTSGNHVEAFSYQLTIFHTDFDALCTLADTIMGALEESRPTAATLIHRRTNRIMTTEVVNGVYTYSVILDYEWTYNTLVA